MQLISKKAQAACVLQANSKVLVALSGGADSVALLLSLYEICPDGLFAAHLNHGIRGHEADRDEGFCKDLCRGLGIPLTVDRLNVPVLAKEMGQSLEQAARTLRYDFLRRVKAEVGAEAIALGHHRGDQAETVLMHMIRGCGLKGLCGMSYRSGDCIRPLLDVSKTDILKSVSEYCTDSTNEELDATRNRVRMTLMPILAGMNPNIEAQLCRMADSLNEDESFLAAAADKEDARCGSNRRLLSELERPILKRVLLKRLRARQDTVEGKELDTLIRLLSAQSGTEVSWRDGRCAWVDSENIYIDERPEAASYSKELSVGIELVTPRGRLISELVSEAKIPCMAHEAYLDADCITGTLRVRPCEKGDRFTPFGCTGSKLLSDYFTDRKVSRFKRDIPLVCDDKGILYVAGHTIDQRARVGGNTRSILHLIFEEV